jgi:hypothetical protein
MDWISKMGKRYWYLQKSNFLHFPKFLKLPHFPKISPNFREIWNFRNKKIRHVPTQSTPTGTVCKAPGSQIQFVQKVPPSHCSPLLRTPLPQMAVGVRREREEEGEEAKERGRREGKGKGRKGEA